MIFPAFQLSTNKIERSILNKKVLLCEHKRHTTHCVASIPSVVLTGGYPIPGPGPDGGYPHPALDGGTPPGEGTLPSKAVWGTPIQDWMGVPPLQGWGYPLSKAGRGYPPGCELTNKVKLLPSPSFG